MFDVSDFANPTLSSALPVDATQQGWGWSEALYDHHAFQYWAPKNVLAIPAIALNGSASAGYTVRILQANGTPTSIPVTVGLVTSSTAEITAALSADADRYTWVAATIGAIGAVSFSQAIPDILRPDIAVANEDTSNVSLLMQTASGFGSKSPLAI